jgi:hypothetical protein
MIRKCLVIIPVILCLLVISVPAQPALAARGIPGSSEFGFGAHLELSGSSTLESARLANNLELDWIAVDCSWLAAAPKQGVVDWSRFDPVLLTAARSQQAIMLSLTQAPTWALTTEGPDPAKTSQFILQILQHYPNTVRAIELFPGANTAQGWGSQPNPKAYASLLASVQTALQNAKFSMLLVAGGLVPTPAGSPRAQAIDDLVFLQELYATAKIALPVISLQASNLTGDPLQTPEKNEPRVLRHYEEIRGVMLQNKKDANLIWVTHLAPPGGSISASDKRFQNLPNQTAWLSQAFEQMKSQIYIGAAFLGHINPQPNPAEAAFSLLLQSGDYHPFYRSLRDLIAIDHSNGARLRPGQAKATLLKKAQNDKK